MMAKSNGHPGVDAEVTALRSATDANVPRHQSYTTTTTTTTTTASNAPTAPTNSNSFSHLLQLSAKNNPYHNNSGLGHGAGAGGGGGGLVHRRYPDTYAALVASLTSFLAVSIHQILYLRSIYPQSTFLPVRQFNHPVRQSRHLKVCTWINDACSAVETQLLKANVAAVSVVILSVTTNRPLERYTFDLDQMPRVSPTDANTQFESSTRRPESTPNGNIPTARPADLEAQFRAVLARLASACARLTPLPPGEEYLPTLHIALRPESDAPAGIGKQDQLWIAAEPDNLDFMDTTYENGCYVPNYNGEEFNHKNRYGPPNNPIIDHPSRRISRARAKTVPVRTVDAGEMKLEVWVEESNSKFEELDRIHSEMS